MSNTVFYNAHHAPLGAFASFTLGYKGGAGGFDLERGRPSDEPVFIGVESADRPGHYDALPFTGETGFREVARFTPNPDEILAGGDVLHTFSEAAIRRELTLTRDTWHAGDLSFTLMSPSLQAPDPETASEEAQKAAYVPAVYAELVVDNSKGRRARRAFFGFSGRDAYSGMRHVDAGGGVVGVGQGRNTAILTDAAGAWTGVGFAPEMILCDPLVSNRPWGLGACGLVVVEAPAGKVSRFRFAICFHREGRVTSGLEARYWYTRWFDSVESVGRFALSRFSAAQAECEAADRKLADSGLSTDQRWMLAHAVHAYYGSTQLLDHDGKPLWVVNEGEYRMMNTFDLTVDHLFFELAQNPWTVRHELAHYLERYSFEDRVRLPGSELTHAGGLSFTHDMGVANVFSAEGRSSYERAGLHGCFSHMTHEQLTNWVLCAGVYAHQTQDADWLEAQAETLARCLTSLVNRDHPDPMLRTGVMSADSDRCEGGAEITTYDSLDASLGQARSNTYLAGKTWASYVILEKLFGRLDQPDLADVAREQAELCAATITAHAGADGLLPAVMECDSPGYVSRIIPAIEGLVYPWRAGCEEACSADGPYAEYIEALALHLRKVLKPGVCLFGDGGWKLSASSDNSWLSKIYLCQYVARDILGLKAKDTAASDAAHVGWLLHPEQSYWSWSDQIEAGRAIGSKYYPRGVTAWLWLDEAR
jgi:hypothetical protein